jgi:hypothetical protein
MSELPFFNMRVATNIAVFAKRIVQQHVLPSRADKALARAYVAATGDPSGGAANIYNAAAGPLRYLLAPPSAEAHMPVAVTATELEKREFFELGMSRCIRCQHGALLRYAYGCNGRANGDGYGTDRIACGACAFVVDFAFDEDAGPYYFETARWDDRQYRKYRWGY